MKEIELYKTSSGNVPVERFLDSLSNRQIRDVLDVLRLIREEDVVPANLWKKITRYIWEVRARTGSDTVRLLGFFADGSLVILVSGFFKKTRSTPLTEIKTAERRRKDYLDRK